MAVGLPAEAERTDVVEPGDGADLGVDRQPERREVLEGLGVAGEGRPALHLAQLVCPQVQAPRRGDRRVLLPQRARRRVARVHVAALAGCLLRLVERVERGDRHVDLAAHLEEGGGVAAEDLGHVRQRADVGGDVLPDATVAAGGGLHHAPVAIGDRDRDAVDLELAHERNGRVVGTLLFDDAAFEPLTPRRQLGGIHGVVERGHRRAVLDRSEGGRARTADRLGGRVGGDQRRVQRLDLVEATYQRVVLGVGDLGCVELVVELVVMVDLLAEHGDLGRRVLGHLVGHGHISKGTRRV